MQISNLHIRYYYRILELTVMVATWKNIFRIFPVLVSENKFIDERCLGLCTLFSSFPASLLLQVEFAQKSSVLLQCMIIHQCWFSRGTLREASDGGPCSFSAPELSKGSRQGEREPLLFHNALARLLLLCKEGAVLEEARCPGRKTPVRAFGFSQSRRWTIWGEGRVIHSTCVWGRIDEGHRIPESGGRVKRGGFGRDEGRWRSQMVR